MSAGRVVFAIPGDIATPSGGYAYDRRLMVELERRGWRVEQLMLPPGFPVPTAAELNAAEGSLAAVEDDTLVLVDGLAFGAMPEIAARQARRLRLVALVHHPLSLETGLDAAAQSRLAESERTALGFARAVVATSDATAKTLTDDFAVSAERLTVAPPGTDRPGRTDRDGRGSDALRKVKRDDGEPVPLILSIGTLIPRKDHTTLIDGLASIADRDWRCRIVGSPAADPQTAAALERQIQESGLADRITLAGAMPDVSEEYEKADLFVLASRYEGYGMVFAEAMANSLPIVFCAEGAPRDLIPAAAGRRFPPGDADALGAALREFLTDPCALKAAGEAACAAGAALSRWEETAQIVAAVLADVAKGGPELAPHVPAETVR